MGRKEAGARADLDARTKSHVNGKCCIKTSRLLSISRKENELVGRKRDNIPCGSGRQHVPAGHGSGDARGGRPHRPRTHPPTCQRGERKSWSEKPRKGDRENERDPSRMRGVGRRGPARRDGAAGGNPNPVPLLRAHTKRSQVPAEKATNLRAAQESRTPVQAARGPPAPAADSQGAKGADAGPCPQGQDSTGGNAADTTVGSRAKYSQGIRAIL